MRWCPQHRRGWIPPGFDVRHRHVLPGRWHPVAPWAIALATAYSRVFGCAGEVAVTVVPCDQCPTDPLEATHYHSMEDAMLPTDAPAPPTVLARLRAGQAIYDPTLPRQTQALEWLLLRAILLIDNGKAGWRDSTLRALTQCRHVILCPHN
jgi:hypothetical protein